jgi:hypothetical protein
VEIPRTDYVEVANLLTSFAGKDYTYIHPEVLDEKCTVQEGVLHLENRINWEDFRILLVPSCKTMSVNNLSKVKAFYDAGGTIIFTTRLPFKSAETGKDAEITRLIQTIFPEQEGEQTIINDNGAGGKAIFIPDPTGENLENALNRSEVVFDVDYPVSPDLRYIHKVIDGRELYYFANTGNEYIDVPVTLSGGLDLERWDPHDGNIEALKTESSIIQLELAPYHSCFFIGSRK